MKEIEKVKILHPEGAHFTCKLSSSNIESIEQYEDGTIGIIKATSDGEKVEVQYPKHRVHKVVRRYEEQ